jgi:hypothetical protein
MEGYGAVFAPIRWLALRRGDLDGVRRWLPTTMPPPTKNWRRLSTFAARLDGLAALDKADAIERETAPLLDLGSSNRGPPGRWPRRDGMTDSWTRQPSGWRRWDSTGTPR